MVGDQDDARASWQKFLDPESLRFSLSIGALYLTAYELLREALVDRVRDFFTVGWTADEQEVSPEYKTNVLSRHPMPYIASAEWFAEMEALDASDLSALRAIREHRNFVAHNIPRIVMDARIDVDLGLLGEIARIIAKLDRWWIKYVEVPTDPDFDGQDLDEQIFEEAISMRMHNLHLLMSFAAGDEVPLREMQSAFDVVWPAERPTEQPEEPTS